MINYCPGCGARLTNNQKCSNCGLVISNVVLKEKIVQVEDVSYDICSIIGFILSLLNLFVCGFLAIPALIVSIVGYSLCIAQDKKGRWMAEAGIIVSLLTTLVLIVLVLASY